MLWGLWLEDDWIWLDLPTVAMAVVGEFRSGTWRCWGAAPVDGQSPMAGVYFDSTQSKLAKGPLQLMVVAVFFFGGVDQRRSGRPWMVHEGSRGFDVIFSFSRILSEVWLRQLYPYPIRTCLYLYVDVYVFLT
jgi:hypothetical protein